jgi:hypothetical protein
MSKSFAVTYVMLALAHVLAVLVATVMIIMLLISLVTRVWGTDQGVYLIVLGVAFAVSGTFKLMHNIQITRQTDKDTE